MEIEIDKEKFIVLKDKVEICLPKKEFEILNLLCSAPGKVFSRKTIFAKIWDTKSESGERTVDVHIVNIRKKVGQEIIKTVKGVGYKCKCRQ